MQVSVCVCSDVNDLMEELVFPHHPEECRLFIDAKNLRLIFFFFIQNRRLKPSKLVAFSAGKRDSFGTII